MWWGRRGDHEIDGGHGDGAGQGVWPGGQMGGEQGSGQGCPHVYNVIKCFTLETTWKRTLKVTLEKVLSNADVVQKFSHVGGWHGQYILKKGLLHVNYVLKRFPVETTWRYTWKLRLGEGLTNADIEDVVSNILPKPQPWRPMSFSTAERSTKGEPMCRYVSSKTSTQALWLCFRWKPLFLAPFCHTLEHCVTLRSKGTNHWQKHFLCEICGKVSTPASNLRKHIWSSTWGKNIKLDPTCINCGFSVIKTAELKSREMLHTGKSQIPHFWKIFPYSQPHTS